MLVPLRRPVVAAVLLTLVLVAGLVALVQRTPHGRVAGVLPIAEPVAAAAVPVPEDGVASRSAHADRALRGAFDGAPATAGRPPAPHGTGATAPATKPAAGNPGRAATRPAPTSTAAAVRQAVAATGAAAHPNSVTVAAAPAARTWVRPSAGPVTSPFGPRWGRFHYGVDVGAPYGAPIHAATDGEVVYVGPADGYGTLVVIRDWDGTLTAYGHMSSYAHGMGPVRAGDVIAYVGAEGDAKGPHLHFEVRTDPRTPVDPAAFLAARGVAL